MKNKYINIVLIALLATLAGCTELENGLVENVPAEEKVTLIATLEGSDDVATKTSLGAPTDNIYPVLWSEGDEIKILTAGHNVADGVGTKMTLVSGAGNVTGKFEGDIPVLPEGCKLYYAVYPYTLGASIGGDEFYNSGISPDEGEWDNITLSNYVWLPFPSVQKYAPSSFAKDYNPSVAVSADAATEGSELKFKNVCGLLQINLTGNVTVGKITLTQENGEPLWGNLGFRYRMRENPFWEEYKLFATNNGFPDNIGVDMNVLTLDCSPGVKLTDEPTDFYFAVPVFHQYSDDDKHVLREGLTIRVYDVNGNEVHTQVTGKDNSIIRSKIRKMPVVDIRTKELEDLSINGTANCYMVKPNMEAKFYAGYRGCTTYPVGDIEEVVVLWETKMSPDEQPVEGSVIQTVEYKKDSGYIKILTGSQCGNALIAAKNQDNILWSWHIWVTEYDPFQENMYDIYSDGYYDYIFMDRNLGALNPAGQAVDNYGAVGLLYEWGRKDPIDFIEHASPQKRYKYVPSEPFNQEHTNGNMGDLDEYSIAHPTTYLFEPSTWHGQAGPPFYNWGKTKSEYDPCPPGWQVADFDVMHDMVSYLTNTREAWVNLYEDHGDFISMINYKTRPTYPKWPHWTNKHNYFMSVHAYGYEGWQSRSSRDQLPVRCQRSNTVRYREVIDLSANGTANSYIVQPNKSYKFKASVKGNSQISVGAISKVDFVYITENSSTVKNNGYGWYGHNSDETIIRDVYYENDYVYFSTSLDQTCGNAVISVKDMHDNVLWSWHIWSVNYKPDVNDDTTYDSVDWGESNLRKVMKMNLGALSNDSRSSKSLGLMYQWGRKDPFVSAIAFDSDQSCIYKGETLVKTDYSEETANVLYSVRHPNEHLAGYDVDGEKHGDWLAESDNSLWGENKTMFDPCPPGWKVPSRPDWEGSKTFSGTFGYGLSMSGVWYPASGFRNYTSFNFNEVGKEGHYWYSTAKEDGSAYVFYFDNDEIDLVNHADFKSQCNPIRCVAE